MVARLRLTVLTVSLLCACAFGAAAQDAAAPAAAGEPAAHVAKEPGKKSRHKKAAAGALSVAPPASAEAEKAARLAEDRRKFFEQSSGFENKDADLPLSIGPGGTPSMGLKF